MIFSSLTFLIIFLPIVFVLYSGRNNNIWKNGVLMITSLLFYAWGGVSYSVVLILSILLNFFIGRKVRGHNKKWLIAGIVLNLLILITFKYAGFFIENISALLQLNIKKINIPLPLGVSFFTFHGISFLTDIYRSEKREPIRLDETTLYICFFPQLVAGPIIRYHDIIYQIRTRTITLLGVNTGIQRFILGLFKKVVIANTAGALADQIMNVNAELLSSPAAWLGILAYTVQIYYDFSGYSDMAIGLGSMFGFKIPENFNYPYIASSIQEFWRRWHISLSTWFRDYVYIPLGGNRKGKFRTYFNLSIIFILTGFWHGATWSFVFWGVFHGFFMIMERLFLGDILKKIPAFAGWIYTMLVVMIAWVFFRIETFDAALDYVKLLFSFKGEGITLLENLDIEKIMVLTIAILFSMPFYPKLVEKLEVPSTRLSSAFLFVRMNILIPLLFLYSVMVLCGSTYNPFIYYRF
ncbi:MAG: MBOAT family protein [Flavobacteriia bacterium]|nr:MBOAT family protein [Flavobacteriia bacterium]OJX36060.1 MAG: hypothetical protein BGO87_06235 [Flavobacteriia bacterium 40-80]